MADTREPWLQAWGIIENGYYRYVGPDILVEVRIDSVTLESAEIEIDDARRELLISVLQEVPKVREALARELGE